MPDPMLILKAMGAAAGVAAVVSPPLRCLRMRSQEKGTQRWRFPEA